MSIVRQNTLFILTLFLLTLKSLSAYSQQVVDGSALVFTRINNISCLGTNDPDTLFVSDATLFSIHDTVLVYQTQGATAYLPGSGEGEIESMYNTGKYAIFKIGEIVDDTTIVLNTTLPQMNPYQAGEVGQLIKIRTYERAVVEPGLSFPSWDPVTRTGGVFPLLVKKTLTLNADIDATGKGFRGGQPAGQYTNDCADSNPDFLRNYYIESAMDTAAGKGESLIRKNYPYTRGRGFLGNGGGGGNGKFSGGGGGSNWGQGGYGGKESSACPVPGKIGGVNGQSLGTYYSNKPSGPGSFYFNRLYFGGGGGTANQDISSSRSATAGGNGGGIIIILADTLVGNSHRIMANGESVLTTATAGAGGGGGGGVVVLNVEHYAGNLDVSVRGGNGGNTRVMTDTTGPGGGGGGGMVWYRGASLGPNVSVDTVHGNSGVIQGSIDKYYDASKGADGGTFNNLLIPIRGFIINTVPSDQTICENEVPAELNARMPAGGSGSFTYKWQQSTNTITWVDASGPNPINEQTYQPPVLVDTTYYRRIVTDQTNVNLADTSFFVTVNVQPALNNNLVTSDDTVCYNNTPGTLSASAGMTGGIGTYDYRWIQRGTSGSWSDASGTIDQASYSVPALTDTTYFKRVVISGVCVDTSNQVSITVLASLTGNTISADQTICNDQEPAPLTGPVPGGGDPADKRYLWEIDSTGVWKEAGNTTQDFTNPGSLSAGTYKYRRRVMSGSQDACVSTSNELEVIVLPDIGSNNILNGDTTICSALPSLSIHGNVPSGGDAPQYKYIWQKRSDLSDTWTSAAPKSVNEAYLPGSLSENTWIRRMVYSGPGDVCQSISDSIKISTLPVITGNTISSPQTVCEGIIPSDLAGSAPAGGGEGPGTYSWQWQKRTTGENQFTDISTGGNQKDLVFTAALTDTTEFRRIVLSGSVTNYTCRDTSSAITISVPPAIGDNLIAGATDRQTCIETSPAILDGTDNPTGGNGSYNFSWEQSLNGTTWVAAAGVNSTSDYQPGLLNEPLRFRRIVSSAGVCFDTTETVSIDTLTRPVLVHLVANRDSICHLEKNFALDISIRYGSPDYSVWYTDGTGAGAVEVSGLGQSGKLAITNFPQQRMTYTYHIDTLIDANGCYARPGDLLSYSAKTDLFPDAEPVILLDDSTTTCGNELQIEANPDIGMNYYWTVSNAGISLDDNSSAKTFARVSGHFDSRQAVLRFFSSSPGCETLSGYKPPYDSVKIAFFEQPEPLQMTEESAVIFIADQYIARYAQPVAGDLGWSVIDGSGDFSIVGSDSTLIAKIPEGKNVYRLTVSNGNCEPVSADVIVERREVNVYDGISPLNPDGINDFLVAEGLDVEDVTFNFQVFSTSGLLVREITEKDIDQLGFRRGLPNNGLEIWDGKGKNQNSFVPPGVYYYVLEVTYKGKTYPIDKNYVVVK